MKKQAIGLLGILVALSVLVGCAGDPDNTLRKKIVGTWASTEPSDVITDDQISYFPNGTFSLSATRIGFFTDKRILASGKWDVKDGYLNWTVEISNVTDVIPNGFSSADKILKVTDKELTYVYARDGSTKVDRRIR